ncbi:SDR family oxidoreductase [Flavivirga rizhaonensis]|uniref:SDR family oxidoreductase n=1 Tax=Flavivirga rizhaonensis TaxID=2559571 RepID=A0A4S1DRQ7_9FLAO|nr:SDR family oxidoreductase [Flavivirga rizhaonensis]TGV00569.1 SDR family oxidoreductase [Flavivirga rizhaonensis]
MKILVTGTTGYIGKRLIPILLELEHDLICCVRDINRVPLTLRNHTKVSIIEVDFLKEESLNKIPEDIDLGYYLIHSMSSSVEEFECLEKQCALNFKKRLEQTKAKQVIYLSGIVNDNQLSKHLQSRYKVEQLLQSSIYDLTTFRAGIIVGSGSASFEIIRDLVEKLPVMVTPKWVNTKCQPIAIRDVLAFLSKAILHPEVKNRSFDIVGPDILSYKQMMMQFARVRKLKRHILTVPVMTPKLSSYWLFFITATSYKLAISLVDSMKVEVIGKPSNINQLLNVDPIDYKQAVQKAFQKTEQNSIVSSWKDSLISGRFDKKLSQYIEVPQFGCFKDIKKRAVKSETQTIKRIWAIGGQNGWYYGTILWKIRGLIDKAVGGIGLRRGRRHPIELQTGDALDFWRVLYANNEEKRLLLFAEMRLPGEAWLEFRIINNILIQKATFRPKGIWGRLYWYAVLPFHGFIFNGMINKIAA